jgi:hypothetical protein
VLRFIVCSSDASVVDPCAVESNAMFFGAVEGATIKADPEDTRSAVPRRQSSKKKVNKKVGKKGGKKGGKVVTSLLVVSYLSTPFLPIQH